MENQVLPNIKKERSKKIIELSDIAKRKYDMSYIGKEVDVLIEEKENGYYKGHTKNYILVGAKEKEDCKNKICKVRVNDIKNDILIGRILNM